MVGKSYVVFNGHRPDNYNTWEEAKAQVYYYRGAHYKMYKDRREAEATFSEYWGLNDHPDEKEVDIQMDVESESTGEEGVQTAVVAGGSEGVSSKPKKTAGPARGKRTQTQPSNKTPRTSTSIVWQHATKFKENGEDKASCNYCGHPYFVDFKRNGTSSLKQHVLKCPKNPMVQAAKENYAKQAKLTLNNQEDVGTWKYVYSEIRKTLAKMIIVDELPFRFVEGKGFREFMEKAEPRFTIPSRQTITKDCFEIYEEAHFIDYEWRLKKKIINFYPINNHKSEGIGKTLEKCLKEWSLCDKVFSVTVDNATPNDVAVAYLKNLFVSRESEICEGKYLHMRCVSHILNLIVREGLKYYNETVARIRDSVKYVRASNSRLAKFLECAVAEDLDTSAGLC
ncbi:putative Zinc finger, BED-type [Corchorus capsularis]|uniref:Putative Zinc finger, BED-type n=1 Tax=Corchorus capsularis TaxID=210143 RepID=A0A1R3JWI1_COCAP|nr:putative Zinc finger, BED-type [Corchorus capsularis]